MDKAVGSFQVASSKNSFSIILENAVYSTVEVVYIIV